MLEYVKLFVYLYGIFIRYLINQLAGVPFSSELLSFIFLVQQIISATIIVSKHTSFSLLGLQEQIIISYFSLILSLLRKSKILDTYWI